MRHNLRALSPVLNRILDHRKRVDKEISVRRVVGRGEDGTTLYLGSDSECVERGPESPYPEAQIIEGPAAPRFSSRGTSGIAVLALQASASLTIPGTLEPNVFLPGQCYEVTLTGVGFTPQTNVRFLLPGPEHATNPDIDLQTVEYVSSHELQLYLCVAEGATLQAGLPLEAGRILPDAYSVAIETEDRDEWFAAYTVALDWRGVGSVAWPRAHAHWTVYAGTETTYDTGYYEVDVVHLINVPAEAMSSGVPSHRRLYYTTDYDLGGGV